MLSRSLLPESIFHRDARGGAGARTREVAPRPGYRLSEADAFADWRGNVAAVHRTLHAGQPGGLSLRRLQLHHAGSR